MHKKRFTLARIKDGVIIEEFKGTFAEAFLAPHDEEVLVTADENFFRNLDEVLATQPAVNRMRWQQLRPKFADFAANAHGIIRADKSGNAVLEEIHAH
ncbi:MAG: hypothetical protein IJR52_04415 [Selenomonadaceae bacterium]|nr:hypothetical protein [Selenomonadaceae bacterium]MBR0101947.1 hypothetical protein [Selenomonadaceae bacterium]